VSIPSGDTVSHPQMLTLALDTTTVAGSLALARDDRLLEATTGTPDRTHGERLPGELVALLSRHDATLREVERFVVAAGPGSFTGLRVGIATAQGLALTLGRPVIAIPVFDALVEIARRRTTGGAVAPAAIVPWMDGARREVFSAIYAPATERASAAAVPAWRLEVGPVAERPLPLLERWGARLGGRLVWFIGDAVIEHQASLLAAAGPGSRILADLPVLAGTLAVMASRPPWRDGPATPHALRPIYVRRPDAEIARDRRRKARG